MSLRDAKSYRPPSADTQTVIEPVTTFLDGIAGAVPSVLAGLAVLGIAYAGIAVVRVGLRSVIGGLYPADQELIVDFVLLVVTVLLWFSTALVVLRVIGMGEIAASLGTATGFVALGVSCALSEMIEDTVAGIYLLRDPDFNPGDTVTTVGMTAAVLSIGLRKSRFELENGDTAVHANRAVESDWIRQATIGSASRGSE